MIRRFQIGTPIDTEAVVVSIEPDKGEYTHFQMNLIQNEISLSLEKQDAVYGLGENVRGINKRGFIYESKCDDDPIHTEGRRSLYAAHNFFVVDKKEPFGVFIDCPGKVTFDIGFTNLDTLSVKMADPNYDLYIIEGEELVDIIKQFRILIGQSYIPPKWAFGYGQSRWSYETEEEVREVANKYKEEGFPIDSIYLDIDYMERYKDFTVDTNRFPNLTKLSNDLKEQGIRLVPIIDAGVKIEDGYDVYEEGVKNGYFCKDEKGNDFVVGVWPGKVHLPDVLNKDARRWFGLKYKFLLDQGIEGFWNDMNEPALFYSEEHLQEVFDYVEKMRYENLDVDTFCGMMKMFHEISNNEGDYKRFFHNIDGKQVRHNEVHNLFGYNMTRAAGEAFEELEPDKRILMFSRSSYIGMHRYGGIWTGDNMSWWSHILMNLKMLPSLNMCGFLYVGADLGGFGDDTSEDLMLRWLSLGIFTPLMRNHSAKGTRRQELYQFGNTDAFKRILKIRYALIPYLYSEYMKAALNHGLMFTPLAFAYKDDERAKEIEDQLLVGESIMIAPVYTQNATGRYVYLPENMKMVRMHSDQDYETKIMRAGDHYIKVDTDEIVFFIRENHVLPIASASNCVDNLDEENLSYLSYIVTEGEYELYQDDGYSKDYENNKNYKHVTVDKNGTVNIRYNS